MPPERRRYETLVATAVIVVATLALAYPAFGGGTLLNANSDQYIAGFAFRDYAAQSLKNGTGFPMWNPYLFAGMPYVGAMHGDIFYPTFLLRMLMPTDLGMTWGMILHVMLAGIFMWLFLRRALGVSTAAATIAGVAYAIGGNVGGLVSPGHDGKIFVASLLPLTLFFVHRAVRDGRWWAWGAVVLVVMFGTLTPHPQLLQYLLLTSGAYALFVAFSRSSTAADALSAPTTPMSPPRAPSPSTTSSATVSTRSAPPLPRADALKRLGLAAVCVVVGLLGGAVQYLPLFEYKPYSPRAVARGWEHAVSYSMPTEELLNFYLPQFSGMLDLYSGQNGIHLHSEYVGVVTLVLAGLAFGIGRERRGQLVFWSAVFVVATLWALGGNTPFFSIVYALVPGTKDFRAPSTMLYVVSFALATLAAFGVDRAFARGITKRHAAIWGGFAMLVLVMVFGGMLTNVARHFAIPALEPRVDANVGAMQLGAVRSLAFALATLGVLLAATRGKLTATATGWVLALLLVADLWSIERAYWRFGPRASTLYAGDAVTEYLAKAPQPGRVLAAASAQLPPGIRDPYLGSGEGKGTGFMVHGIRSVSGYHGNELGRYDELSAWDTDGYFDRISNPNVLRVLNVRYLYTNAARPSNDGQFKLLAGPTRNAAGNTVYLYEMPGDHSYAWVTPLAVSVPDETALATIVDQRFDPARAAIIAPGASVPVQPPSGALPPPSAARATVTKWGPERVLLTIDGPVTDGSALMVSENWYPGWTATVDGVSAPVGRADYSLIAVGLKPGAKQVELSFDSDTFERGWVISLVVLVAGIAGTILGLVFGRRRDTVGAT